MSLKCFYICIVLQCFYTLSFAQNIKDEISADTINEYATDSIFFNVNENDALFEVSKDSILQVTEIKKDEFIPNSTKAVWYSAIFPGLGQVYNKKYWKLPIIYGAFVGITYGLSFNQRNYTDYSMAYRDVMDDNPNTNSHEDFLPPNHTWSESQIQTVMKRKKDFYRRNRDLSIIGMIAMYAVCMLDAYVDAELYTFDISQDLSLRVEPVIMNNHRFSSGNAIGLQCQIKF